MAVRSAPDPAEVSAAVAGWLSARFAGAVHDAATPTRVGGGFDFWIYSLHFVGASLPVEWSSPLIARIPPTPERFPLLQRESQLQDWTASHGYPAPQVRAVVKPGELFAQPVQLVERVPGRTMNSAMTSAPWRLPRLLDALAGLQARLHAVAVPDVADPVEWSVIERRLGLVRFVIDRIRPAELVQALDQIQGLLPALEVPDPVICHGDLHPLNVLVEGDSAWLVDWTDAGIGDRHADIARTAWLFRFAAVAAPARAPRAFLGAIEPYLTRRYLTAYRRRFRFDPVRLRLWKPLHLLHAWAMTLADGAELVGPSRAGQDFRPGLAEWARDQFAAAMDDLPRPPAG